MPPAASRGTRTENSVALSAPQIREYIDQHGGVPVVVLSPRDQIGHLSSSDLLETQVLNDNGDLDVAIVRWK